ncbi:MAG: ABC transporter substrate-binding protein [Lachnospiraceae bacterium]|nr:ABC transporter substrate-binding protein [Lachnospiraceae bacterium]
MRKMKKIAALALSLLTAVSLLAGCGQKSPADQRKAKNEIAVGIAQDLGSSLDPRSLASAGAREVLFNVFEGLYKPTSSGDFVPALATDCQVTDEGKTYTFTLREGVKFHNGKTMTADDVVYTFKSYAESSTDSNLKAALGAMADVKADGNKVTVTLTEANSDFMAYVASIHVIPSDYTEQETKPVGTGPFRYESRSVQESIVLVRNDDYYGTKAKVSKVTYKIYETGTALVTALAGGAVDIVAHMTEQQVKGLSKDYTVLEGTMNLVQALYLNNAEGPLADVRVRQALCYAVDVQNMLDLTAGGHGTRVGSSIYPAFTKYFDASLADAYPHDVAKAKDLLKQAGYENGFDLVITVPGNYTNHVDTAVVLASQLKEAGVNATVQEVEWNTWLKDVYQGRKYQATVVGFDASMLTAGAMLNRFVSGSSKNISNFASAEYDALIAEASSITDDARRTECYRAAEKILSDEAANVYLQDMADFVAIRSTLDGYHFYPLYVMDLSTVGYK